MNIKQLMDKLDQLLRKGVNPETPVCTLGGSIVEISKVLLDEGHYHRADPKEMGLGELKYGWFVILY